MFRPSSSALGVALIMLVAPATAQAADPARAPVQSLSDGLIGIMKGGAKLGLSGRAAQIAPVVDRVFDIPLMTRLAVGPAWLSTSAADQAALVAAFRKLTINEYARNFDSWAGQAISVSDKVEVRGTDRLVKTSLTQPGEDPVSIAYRLRQTGGDWRVIDVFFKNSISQLTTRRADFAAIVAKGGAKALIAHINRLAEKGAS
ncbi:MAG: hopanoid biosynthesis protein HpnM [Sphingomonas sp. 28-66-16]|nr:MAG: hopanoid biosynthesis protein HpnM [Sphingomonas sp. 28-66-16]